jgi:cytochrome c5
VAVVIIMNRLGLPGSPPTPRQLVLHRFFGWGFVALFLLLIVTMFTRFYVFWEEHPARIVFHYALSFALLLLLLFKVAVARRYPGFRKQLFAIGLSVFILGFTIASIGLSHYFVRMTQRSPFISFASLATAPDLQLGKQLLIERCTTCHILSTILQTRSVGDWEKVVDDMTKRSWPRIRLDEATQILTYLSEIRVPKEGSAGTGFAIIDETCFTCHGYAEVFGKIRTRKEWDEVVRRMSETAPDKVPVARHGRIVDALLEAQAKAAALKKAEDERQAK